MNRAVLALLALFVVQCGLVALVYWPGSAGRQAADSIPFAPFDPAALDRLAIGDAYDNEAVLARSGGRWIIPGLHGLPADEGKIDALLKGLAAGNDGWPIAQSPEARRRFQVDTGNYQRRLELAAGGAPAGTFYLGTSPGFGKVHARNGEQESIYSIALNNFEILALADRWLDPRLLQVRVPLRIDSDLYHLRFEDGAWLTGAGSAPDADELAILLTALKNLQVLGVADEDQARSLADWEADLIMEVESLAGTATFELIAHEERYFLKSSEYPLFFEIGEDDFTRLAGIDIGLITGEADAR